MNKPMLFLWMSGLCLTLASCSRRSFPNDERIPDDRRFPPRENREVIIIDRNPQNLPPGQSKKIYGDQSARNHAPGHRKKMYGDRRAKRYTPGVGQRGYPLIIFRTPGIIIQRWNDGSFYHRNADGLIYWQANDGGFYLDQRYIDDVQYDEVEYRNWYRVVQPAMNNQRNNNGNRDWDDDRRDRRERGKGHHKRKHRNWDDD
jgi:hypothetical protein